MSIKSIKYNINDIVKDNSYRNSIYTELSSIDGCKSLLKRLDTYNLIKNDNELMATCSELVHIVSTKKSFRFMKNRNTNRKNWEVEHNFVKDNKNGN